MDASEIWYGVLTQADVDRAACLRVRDHPFLRGFGTDFVGALGSVAVDTTYAPGQLLAQEGEVADRFHLIYHGKVAIEGAGGDGLRRTVQTIGPGEVLGWSWLAPPYLWQVDGRALKETRVVSIDTAVLRQTLADRPADGCRFLQRLVTVIGQLLENTRVQLLSVEDRGLPARTSARLSLG